MTNEKRIFLDYMATTPVDLLVQQEMINCLRQEAGELANASSTHIAGRQAKQVIDHAAQQVADTIGAKPEEIVWTSGATEANNLAIKGVAYSYKRQGNHLITLQTEHHAVLDVMKQLEAEGFEITYLPVNQDGLLDLDVLKAAIRSQTILISVMQVNNEIGVIQPIADIAQIAHEAGVLFHVDAAQSVGKLRVDVKELGADLLSLSAHKAYGPCGIGALYIRSKPPLKLKVQMQGGSQQQGRRAGTLPVHQIVGMGQAFALAAKCLADDMNRLSQLRDYLWQELQLLGGVVCHGSLEHRVANNLNVGFAGVHGDALMYSFRDQILVSRSSACTAASIESSHVLLALGADRLLANASIRFSLGRTTSMGEIEQAIGIVSRAVKQLRALSPLTESI